MPRTMIDTTHSGLPGTLAVIRNLPPGSLVAMYDTGSPYIQATPEDWAQIPADLVKVAIDQRFTGSPNMDANERDCENGAWTLADAVNRNGWNVKRPSLYLGYPDTFQQAYDLGWRGDVRLVMPSTDPPNSIPVVPIGINVTGIQWDFSHPDFDGSKMFDPFWPEFPPTKKRNQDMTIVTVTAPAGHVWTGTRSYLYAPGTAPIHLVDEGDRAAFASALGLASVTGASISWDQFVVLGGA